MREDPFEQAGPPADAAASEDRREALLRLQAGCTSSEALRFYDALPAVGTDDPAGCWRGTGLHTGHPLDGLLEACGWIGKRVDGADGVHPLVFRGLRGRPVSVAPGRLPASWATLRFAAALPRGGVPRLFRLVLPLLGTRRPGARVRVAEYRGVATATLVYDRLPIMDALRRVDEDTMVGAMDLRGMPQPFLFVLTRRPSPSASSRRSASQRTIPPAPSRRPPSRPGPPSPASDQK